MDDRVEAAKKKKWRRTIIDLMKTWSPDSVTFRELLMMLPELDTQILARDLDYLIKAGHVMEVKSEPNKRQQDKEYELTASGIETADKINVDPNLEP